MKKSILKISIIFIIIIMLITGGFFVTKLNMKFPDKVTYGNGTDAAYCADGGMYYIKNKCIYFLDSKNQINTVVCNKANCTHNTVSCNAYMEDFQAPTIICYGDYLYVSLSKSNISFNDGEASYTGLVKLDCIKCDGSSRRTIYSADSGAVTSMKAIGDKLYFTTWAYPDPSEYVLNSFVSTQTLYEYDLRWNKLKTVLEYPADENHEISRLDIVKGNVQDVYVMYDVYDKDGSQRTQLLKYDDNKMMVIKEYYIADFNDSKEYIDFVINESEQLEIIKTLLGEANDVLAVSSSNDCFQTKKLMFTIDDAHDIAMNDGYILFVNSDYNKIMLDCYSMNMYFATTCFEGEKYISDILDIDEENNAIYIDATDYTGILPGTIFYEDPKNQAVADFDVFMSNYFIDKASVNHDDIAKLTWVHFED